MKRNGSNQRGFFRAPLALAEISENETRVAERTRAETGGSILATSQGKKKTTNQRRHQTKSTHRSAPQIVALISSNKKETNKQKRRRRTEKKVRKKKRETESALWSCPVVIPLFFSIPVSSSGFYSTSEAFYWVFTGFSSLLQNRLQVGPGTRWD